MRNQNFSTTSSSAVNPNAVLFPNQFTSLQLKEERPTYKINNWGTDYMDDLDLLCLIMPNSDWDDTKITARRMLLKYGNQLSNIAKASPQELADIEGVSQYAANQICAAFEIGRRKLMEQAKEQPQIRSSKDAFNALYPILNDLQHEEFWILVLNRANRIINTINISKGGLAGTVVDAKIIFKMALEYGASSLVLAHNHPSGNAQPSQADIDITKKLKIAGKTLDISILDHIIVAQNNNFYSFADEGMI